MISYISYAKVTRRVIYMLYHCILCMCYLINMYSRLTEQFFAHFPLHPSPPVQQIGNHTLVDLTNLYKTYKHKHMLL